MLQKLRQASIRAWFGGQMAWHGVLANPLRSALTILGVAIGVTSVISLMAIGEGARQTVVEQFKSLGANVIVVRAEDPKAEFDPDEAENLLERVDVLTHATPVIQAQTVMRWRRARGVADIVGVNEQFPMVRDHPLASGSFFTSLHVKQRSAVAVLGYNVGAGLLQGRSPIGHTMTLDGRTFRIIGVLTAKGAGKADDIDDKVLIPYTAAEQITKKHKVQELWLKAGSPEEADLAIAQLGRIFRRKLGLDPGAPTQAPAPDGGAPLEGVPAIKARAVMAERAAGAGPEPSGPNSGGKNPGLGGRDLISITNLNQMVDEADKANRVMTLLLGGIAAVSLLVGGLGIMNIMLVAVTERTVEIGVRRALGATRGDLLLQFLLEALYLSGAGALAGIAAGLWGTSLFAEYGLHPVISLQALWTASLVAIGSGLVFGVYPAYSASSVPPMEALRR